MRSIILAMLAPFAIGCASDIDEPWDLNHDRVIAVRADKPGLLPGDRTELVGLIGHVDAPTEERPPLLAGVVEPMSLASMVTTEGGRWYVDAPSADMIAAARSEMKIPAEAPVPVTIAMQFRPATDPALPVDGQAVLTTIRVGMAAENPVIGTPTIDGNPLPPAGTQIVIDSLVDVRLAAQLADKVDINWLTSVGQMHDFDLAKSYVRVEIDDPLVGELAVVIRDRLGGVSWLVWPMTANPPEMPAP